MAVETISSTSHPAILILFAPGAPREHYFEGLAQLGELTEEQRREWFVKNDNHFV